MQTNIYLMRDGHSGLYKIGRSITPKIREKTLLSQAPLVELHVYWKDQPESEEAYLHARFDDKRQRGEWFELDDADVDFIYHYFADADRVDTTPVPDRLQSFCNALSERSLRIVKGPRTVTVEKVVEKIVYSEEPVSGLGTRYSERTLKEMREMIMLLRGEARKATNPDVWNGFVRGVVWASGVD